MPLNVIGLISGGKDSLYCLAHCIQNGHTITALANLCPPTQDGAGQQDANDLDSFMYQTVGHSVIPLYAEALELPLYRHVITGKAAQSDKDYGSSNIVDNEHDGGQAIGHDETEDMLHLLQNVLKHHPEANAVSAGAIFSTYQRTRVESVAIRLGLVPLAFLWQYPCLPPPPSRGESLTSLLDDMALAGCDARIIKIASAGILEKSLFSNIVHEKFRQSLVRGLSIYANDELELRGSVLGEGGEYETLALDGPSNLWKKCIYVSNSDSYSEDGGTIYARLKDVTLQNRTSASSSIPVPSMFDEQFKTVIESSPVSEYTQSRSVEASSSPQQHLLSDYYLPSAHNASGDDLHLFNMNSPAGSTATQQLTAILRKIPDVLIQISYDPHFTCQDIVSTTLLLQDMNDFAAVNAIYSKAIWPEGTPLPPARVTVAAPLPEGTLVSLSMILHKNEHQKRTGLHVQSQSYWAPANIGPYSQAITIPIDMRCPSKQDDEKGHDISIVHMAGQIPLDPASMTLLPGTCHQQAVLALQHLWRVGQERKVDLWAGAGVAYIARNHNDAKMVTEDDVSFHNRIRVLATIWRKAHDIDVKSNDESTDNDKLESEEDEDIDLWDMQYNRGHPVQPSFTNIGHHLHVLPNFDVFNHQHGHRTNKRLFVPTFIAAEVSELPRNAPVEWWSTGLAGLKSATSAQRCRVHCFEQTFASWSFRGFALETSFVGDNDNGRQFNCFLTLLQSNESSDEEKNPATAAEVKEVILRSLPGLEQRRGWTSELVTCHTLLNLSSMNRDLQSMPLVQMSTIVPCYNVWAATYNDARGRLETSGDGVVGKDICAAVSAAVVIRLDVSCFCKD